MNKKIAVVISCEHAVNTVPKEYKPLFEPFQHLLTTHRGIDFGAYAIAEHLKKALNCDYFQATSTRLLIDCNRSLGHSNCFSEITNNLSSPTKQIIINNYYTPFRKQVIDYIEQNIKKDAQVWHLSIHSFTPTLGAEVRNTDIGLLYDPSRYSEKNTAKLWQLEIKKQAPEYTVRMNYPYRGISDGFTSAIRKKYPAEAYIGIEVESNQALTMKEQSLDTLKNILSLSLLKIMC